MVQKRDLAICIILSIVTCGIYGLYWFICLNNDSNTVSHEQNPTSGGMALLLTIVTCGIYGLYWMYKTGNQLDSASQQRGMGTSSRGVLYLVLSLFGLAIVSYALMQDTINKIVDVDNGGAM